MRFLKFKLVAYVSSHIHYTFIYEMYLTLIILLNKS